MHCSIAPPDRTTSPRHGMPAGPSAASASATCFCVCAVSAIQRQAAASQRLSLDHWQRRASARAGLALPPGIDGSTHPSRRNCFPAAAKAGVNRDRAGMGGLGSPSESRRCNARETGPVVRRLAGVCWRPMPGAMSQERVTTAAQKTPDARSDLVNHRDACTRLLIIHAVASRTFDSPSPPTWTTSEHIPHHQPLPVTLALVLA